MPIEKDCKGYETGHFRKVYDLLIKPAIENAGMTSLTGSELEDEENIQLQIIQKLINAPVVVCDVSSLNPKIAIGLGIRNTYKKPIILLWDDITPRAYNIKDLVCIDYCNALDEKTLRKTRKKLKTSIQSVLKSIN